VEIREKMQVDRFKIHDIEVVIDRIRVNPTETIRLQASLQTALKMGKGLIMVMDYLSGEIRQFSEKLMDENTGLAYDEASPNTFSFNSPYGACPTCRGLGTIYEINKNSLISSPDKSISEGGIAPLGEFRDNLLFRQVRELGKKYGFTLGTKVKDLSEQALNLILYGTMDHKMQVPLDYGGGEKWYSLDFGGVVNMLRKAFENTSSEGIRKWAEGFMEVIECPECNGARLKKSSLYFKIDGHNIADLARMNIDELIAWLEQVEDKLNPRQKTIAHDLLKELRARLGFMLDVGLDYLILDRPSRTLSGGESQRIRLATQIGSELSGITYILDEPSIGLHQRDNIRLIHALKNLRDTGNTVLVVEHDREIMESADHIIDLGPGAGEHGGEVVAQGRIDEIINSGTLTAQYLKREKEIEVPKKRRKGNGHFLEITGAKGNNIKNVHVKIPLGTFTCITGVSGSGKSTLLNETIYPVLNRHFYRARKKPLSYDEIHGLQHLDKVIEINQSPIGRTPRSNPATYIGVFTEVRKLFAQMPEAKIRGYLPGRFSFNVKGGRCEQCKGGGMRLIEMNFLPDVYVLCETCHGKRYNRETLNVHYKGKNINDVLNMTVEEASVFFEHVPAISRKLKMLESVGLSYIRLGQSSTTISGGEAQRVKLSAELSKKDTGNTFYILDEPTTGLHFEDIRVLLHVLDKLVSKGNTVVVIEHNMDVIKVADHIIDMGPEGGHRGGQVVATGTPEEVAASTGNYTGGFLRKELG
jgi:excinuclease ABC subunit A